MTTKHKTVFLLACILLTAFAGKIRAADSTKIVYPPELTQEEANALVDRLFIQASSGEIKYRGLVGPSKDSIGALGALALPRMMTRLAARDARERWTISDIFTKLGTVATDSLLNHLGSDDQYVLLNVGRCLGQIKDTASTLACLPLLAHEKYPVRSQFASTLGKNKDPRATPKLIDLLESDAVEDVRKSAAVALGRIGDNRAAAVLIRHLADPNFGVRKTASRSLVQLDPIPLDQIAASVATLSGIGPGMALETLGLSHDKQAEKILAKYLKSTDPLMRGYAVDALATLRTKGARKRLRHLVAEIESDPFVRARIRAAQSPVTGGK